MNPRIKESEIPTLSEVAHIISSSTERRRTTTKEKSLISKLLFLASVNPRGI